MEVKEKEVWDEYFSEALQGKGQESAPSLWWKLAHEDLVHFAVQFLAARSYPVDILEAGCGSGTSSYELSHLINLKNLYFLDISKNALDFAKQDLHLNRAEQAHFIEGSIFDLSSFKEKVDLCWNVGLIEHYSLEEIRKIVDQMFSTLKPGGILFIGMPNRYSLATIKAAVLGSRFGRKFCRFIKGYRNQTEILYGNTKIRQLIEEVTHESVHMRYAGSSTLVESADTTVRFFRKYFPIPNFNFISCFVVTKR